MTGKFRFVWYFAAVGIAAGVPFIAIPVVLFLLWSLATNVRYERR